MRSHSRWTIAGIVTLTVLLALACKAASPATTQAVSSTAGVTSSPPPAPAYTGQFDCEGLENGLRAYSGRIDIQRGGLATFKDYDGTVQTGTWTYDASATTFTFAGSLPLASAIYMPGNDTLVVVFLPNAVVVHAANGGMKCQRAVPGKTGPP